MPKCSDIEEKKNLLCVLSGIRSQVFIFLQNAAVFCPAMFLISVGVKAGILGSRDLIFGLTSTGFLGKKKKRNYNELFEKFSITYIGSHAAGFLNFRVPERSKNLRSFPGKACIN